MTRLKPRALRALLIGLLPLAACATTGVTTPRSASSDIPTLGLNDSLVEVAETLVSRATGIARVWPGFWSASPSFLILQPRTAALFVHAGEAPPGYRRIAPGSLPPVLRGRAWLRTTYPEELGENQFNVSYVVGGDTVPALAPLGGTLRSRLDFYLHEAFHGFQARRFKRVPEDTVAARFAQPLVPDTAFVQSVDFRRRAEAERRILLAVLALPASGFSGSGGGAAGELLRMYLAVRATRTGENARVSAVEHRLERTEGTAEYVGCAAAAIAVDDANSAEATRRCIRTDLERPLSDFLKFPERDAQLMRWRLYGTGGSMALALDALVQGWQAQVRDGAFLDELLAKAVGYDPATREALDREAMERFQTQ